MRRLALVFAWLVAHEAVAAAQASSASFDAVDAVEPTSVVEGAGVKIGEGTLLRPVFGVETGVVSNVFYEDASPASAGLLRLLAQVGAGSLGRQRLAQPTEAAPDPLRATESGGRGEQITNPGSFQYRADLRLSYDLMLSGNDRVNDQGGLGVGALFAGLANPQKTFQVSFIDDFERLIRPTNFESADNTNRDINHFQLGMIFAPPGRTLSGRFTYDNLIDVFESDDQQFANRIQHTFGLRGMWQWLPQTRVYADARFGVFSGLGDSTKVDSYPLTVQAGLQTLFTLRTTFAIHAGYTNGFYSSGPSYSAPAAGAQIGYRYSPLGRVTFGYEYLHADSINANFYRDHLLVGTLEQAFAPIMFTLRPELHFREYEGVVVTGATSMNRNDLVFAIAAGAHYNFRNWIAATLDYHLALVSTDFRYMPEPGVTDDPGYVRHELLLGVRAAL